MSTRVTQAAKVVYATAAAVPNNARVTQVAKVVYATVAPVGGNSGNLRMMGVGV